MKHIVLLLLSAAMLFSYGCQKDDDIAFTGSGTFEALDFTICAQTRGEIIQLNFEEGNSVEEKAVMAEIDVEQLLLQKNVAAEELGEIDWNEKIIQSDIETAEETVHQAEISMENIQKNRTRLNNLLKQNAATQQQIDSIETEFRLAQSRIDSAKKHINTLNIRAGALESKRQKINANLKLIESQIDDGIIRCPSNGVVLEKYIERGEVANFGTPIYRIADISSVWLIIYISEEDLGKISLNGKAMVSVDSHPGQMFEGTVTWISSEAEFTPKNVQTKESRVDLVYGVKITVDNPEHIFKIGMPADAYIEGF